MLRFLFSFQGRMSRRQYRRGFWLLGLMTLPAVIIMFVLPLLIGGLGRLHLTKWYLVGAIAFLLATLLTTGVSCWAMSVRRAHDLGKPGPFSFAFDLRLPLLFLEGERHDNQYGPAPEFAEAFRPRRRIVERVAGVGLVSIVALCVVFYRLIAGPSWKWPDCRPAISAEGVSVKDAEERWRQAVASTYGPVYAESKMSMMRSTTCVESRCTASGRPCVRVP